MDENQVVLILAGKLVIAILLHIPIILTYIRPQDSLNKRERKLSFYVGVATQQVALYSRLFRLCGITSIRQPNESNVSLQDA